MALYEYNALDRRGKKAKGTITADSPAGARFALAAEGLFPEAVRELRASTDAVGADRWGLAATLFRRVDTTELSITFRHLATLAASGLPLLECLTALADQGGSKTMVRALTQMRERISEGESLSRAMAEHPYLFGDIHINMVAAGESSGALDTVLKRLAIFTEDRARLQKKIEAALIYPLFLLLVGSIILMFMMRFVMPKVVDIFQGMELVLPWSTRALIWLTDMIGHGWWVLLLGALGMVLGFRLWLQTDSGRRMWDKLRLRLPYFGQLHRQAVIARFFRTLSTLLQSGMTLLPALQVAGSATGNRVVENLVENIRNQVETGASVSSVMAQKTLFPSLAVQLVRTGEQSGEMDAMTGKAADVFEEDLFAGINTAMALVEPVIVLCMGLVVGFIVMAILFPIFDMTGGIR